MTSTYRISLDAMGGDHGVSVVVPAAVGALKRYSDIHLVLVGDEAAIKEELSKVQGYDADRLSVRHTTQVVDMDEVPALGQSGRCRSGRERG